MPSDRDRLHLVGSTSTPPPAQQPAKSAYTLRLTKREVSILISLACAVEPENYGHSTDEGRTAEVRSLLYRLKAEVARHTGPCIIVVE